MPNAPRMTARHYRLAKSLVRQGHEVHYIVWETPYGLPANELLHHLRTNFKRQTTHFEEFTMHKLRRLPLFWPWINGRLFQSQVRRLYKQEGYDFIFAEGYTNETEIPTELPYVYDLADDYAAFAEVYDSKAYKIAFKILDVRRAMQRQARNAILVTGVSENLMRFATTHNPFTRKFPNGVDTTALEKILRQKSAPANPHSIVYASGFGRWSRVIETMQAVTNLRSDFPDISLTLIGDGTESEKIQEFIRSNHAESYIKYLGFISNHTELFRHIKSHAIGLNISDKNKWRDASHPMKLMDYSALGKKVVSTDLDEVVFLQLKNVFTFHGTSLKSLESGLRRALATQSVHYDKLAATIRKNYDWDVLAADFLRAVSERLEARANSTVYHVTPSYPPRLGGLEKVVKTLATYQNQSGLRVAVITSDQAAKSGINAEPFPVHRLRSLILANTNIMPSLLPQLLKLRRSDIVHVHVTQAYTPEMVWLASFIRKYTYVAHIHLDVPPSGKFGALLDLYKRLFLRQVLRRAQKVIVPTLDYQQIITNKYKLHQNKVVVMPNASDHQVRSKPRSHPRQKLNLLFVGRLSFQKNIPLLLDALSVYQKRFGSNFVLKIVGDGELMNELSDQAAALGLRDAVSFAGSLSGASLERAYDSADIFVLSSSSESFGLVIVEAMAKGLPVVCTDIPAVRNLVDNKINGLRVKETPDAFAEAIHDIASNKKLYTKMSSHNIRHALDYNWDRTNNLIVELYRQIQ